MLRRRFSKVNGHLQGLSSAEQEKRFGIRCRTPAQDACVFEFRKFERRVEESFDEMGRVFFGE